MTVIITAKLQLYPQWRSHGPYFDFITFNAKQAMAMTLTRAKYDNVKSLSSTDMVGTDGQTDGADCITFLVKAVCNQHCTYSTTLRYYKIPLLAYVIITLYFHEMQEIHLD